MRTLDLSEAATFLRMHPEEVRRRVKIGLIPGAKAGRAWVFIDEDLADWLRSRYAQGVEAIRLRKGVDLCHSTNADRHGGLTSSLQAESEYAGLLGLQARP